MTPCRPASDRLVARIAIAASGGFAAFYTFYAAAPSVLGGTTISSGTRVGIMMLVVVAVQPLLLLGRRWIWKRRLAVMLALTAMGVGSAILPLAGHWPGSILLGIGFGVFVVMSTVWVKEQAPAGQTGRALGVYGFGSAAGGALGAPIGIYAAEHGGQLAVAVVGCSFALCALIPAAQVTERNSHPESAHEPAPPTVSSPASEAGATSAMAAVSGSLLGHLFAVALYGAALSSAGNTSGPWLPILTALAIQGCLALGRLCGGHLSDRYPPLVMLLLAIVALVLSAAGFAAANSRLGLLAAAAATGFASGAAQTSALTAMMRRVRTPRATETSSAAWNIAFDGGLGLGALVASWVSGQA